MNIIEVENVSFSYGQTHVLRNISFKVARGSFLAVAGPNGAGKSTLINLLSASLKPDSGSVNIDEKAIASYSTKALSQKIAVVRQEFAPVFGFSVIEMVLMARTTHFGRLGFESQIDRRIVNDALNVTDTARFASRLLSNLSSGERQRVFIARAYAQNTPILILDEPTSFLDYKHQIEIFDLLKKSQKQECKTIVAAIHDINLASQYADTALLLGQNGTYRFGPAEEIFQQQEVEKCFGVRMFSTVLGSRKFFLPLGKFSGGSPVPPADTDDQSRCE